MPTQAHLKNFYTTPKTFNNSPDFTKEKVDLPSPSEELVFRSLDKEDFEVEALKPLIPFSMESGLNGNSKTIDNNSSSLGYRSFKGLPQKNQ